jgi:hypothetical protein
VRRELLSHATELDVDAGARVFALMAGNYAETAVDGPFPAVARGCLLRSLRRWHARPMAYPRPALAFALLLSACPSDDPPMSDTGSGTGSPQTSAPTDAGEEGPCPGGGSPCPSGECVFLGSDENNCGGCGNVCPAGEECIAAQCVDTDPCDGQGTSCNGACVDIGSDRNNCGDCDNVCEEGDVCIDGQCMDQGSDNTSGPPPGSESGPGSSSGEGSTSTTGGSGSGSGSSTTGV